MVGIITPTNTSFPVVDDDHLKFSDPSDKTKLARWDIGNNTTATTRVRSMATWTGTMVAENFTGLHNVGLLVIPGISRPRTISVHQPAMHERKRPDRRQSGLHRLPVVYAGQRNAGCAEGHGGARYGRFGRVVSRLRVIRDGTNLGLCHRQCRDGGIGGIWRPPTAALTSFRRFNDGGVVSTTAEGGAGAADSAFTMYSTTARTNVAFRVLGYIEIQTGATAGNWASSASLVRVATQEMPMSGDIVQSTYVRDGAYATNAATIPSDDTIPQIGEGQQYLSPAIAPTSAVNILEVEAAAYLACSGAADYMTFGAIPRRNGQRSRCGSEEYERQRSRPACHTVSGGANATTSTTFSARAGANTNTTYFNGYGAARKMGGVMDSYMRINEIFI